MSRSREDSGAAIWSSKADACSSSAGSRRRASAVKSPRLRDGRRDGAAAWPVPYLAERDYTTVGLDISPSAIELAPRRGRQARSDQRHLRGRRHQRVHGLRRPVRHDCGKVLRENCGGRPDSPDQLPSLSRHRSTDKRGWPWQRWGPPALPSVHPVTPPPRYCSTGTRECFKAATPPRASAPSSSIAHPCSRAAERAVNRGCRAPRAQATGRAHPSVRDGLCRRT